MIEVDKMLHLRRYVLTVLRSDTRSRAARSLHSTSASACKGGYVLRSLHHRHVPSTVRNSRSNYAVCGIRTFSTTVAQSSADDVDQKLTSFCDDVKHGQTWTADRLKEVIQLCDESNYQLQPSAGLLLLKCCGNPLSTVKLNERQDLADRVWRLIKKNGDVLTLEHYNMLLNVHAENSSSVDPNEFLAEMSATPNNDTYRLLFNTAIKTDNTKYLQNIMSVIKTKNILLDEDTFYSLMQIYLAKSNITEALNVITLAQDAKLPVNKLYTELACEYAAQGDIPNLVKILNDEPQSDLNLLKIIKSLSVSGNGRHIPVIMNFLMPSVSTIKPEINNLITELVRANQAVDADVLINCIALNDATGTHVKSFTNNFLTQLIMTNASVEDITKFASSLVESGHEPMALINIAETSLKLGREKLSLAIFTAMEKKDLEIRPHYYWPLLVNAQRNEGEAKIYSLVASMKAMNVEFDFDTFVSYILPYVNTVNPISTMRRLKMIGIPANLLNTSMIYYLLDKHRLDDVIYLYQSYSQMKLDYRLLLRPLVQFYFATRNVENCVKVLTTFRSGHNYVSLFLVKLLNNRDQKLFIEELQLLLETFEKAKVKFTSHDANYLKYKINNVNNTPKTIDELCILIDRMTNEDLQFPMLMTIPYPKYMNTEKLACHFIELKSLGRTTKSVLNNLLKAYCSENNLKKAEEVKRKYDENQYTWTFGMKMNLFDIYAKHDKVKEAAELLLEVQKMHDTFFVDSSKILSFAIALVKAGKPEVAFKVIESFSNVNWEDTNENCIKLLNVLGESKYEKNTEDMLHLLLKKKYCNVSTELLQPLVAIPLRQNDIPSAVQMLKKCAHLYKKLPLVVHVFTALLREKNSSHLQNVDKYIDEVYDMIAVIKNTEVANTIVVIALANLNKMEELRVILQKQRISVDIIMYYLNFAQRINDVDPVLRIIEASENSNNINLSLLCDALLTFYSELSDCTNALALWKLMHKKNIKPSKPFKQGFIEFFQLNRTPLPAEFESDESEVNISGN